MAMTLEQKVLRIKKIILEDSFPMFSDTDIEFYLELCNGNVNNTIYRLLTVKSESADVQLSGMTVGNPKEYFQSIARDYRPNNSGVV